MGAVLFAVPRASTSAGGRTSRRSCEITVDDLNLDTAVLRQRQ
jgi:hypothetical protein